LEAINCFGYDHVIFGSDTPYARNGDQIRKIESLNLTDTAMEHIFKLNIENIFRGNGREMTEKYIEAITSRTAE
jgi:predicted TIM-barrel fold metal-dependent hydrolase